MVIIPSPASRTLDELNQLVREQETALQGSLADIGNDAGSSTISIDDLDPAGAPDPPSQVTTGAPSTGARIVAKGTIFVAGTLAAATAFRS
jgi:hypothetical protein